MAAHSGLVTIILSFLKHGEHVTSCDSDCADGGAGLTECGMIVSWSG